MKIIGSDRDSKCMYCDSSNYGRGCNYGPNKLHVHVDDSKRCVWCGSTNIGGGCQFNPFSKTHQRGITYNPVMVEALENGLTQGIIMNKLSKPISDTMAYKRGLIDEMGNTIREPDNLEESKILSGADKYLIKVRNLLREKLDILNLTLYYEDNNSESIDDIERLYPIELECKDEIKEAVTNLIAISNKYGNKGITSVQFERMIAEAMLNGKRM